ncbi:MAG: SPASM domain-containing protein [Candidatus Bathyarchaeia archaeon]
MHVSNSIESERGVATFRPRYINGIRGWTFSEEEIRKAENTDRMLMLDFEWGIKCSLNCGYCFRREDVRDRGLPKISLPQATKIIEQAKALGCKSIHFVGQGEPFEDRQFLKVLRYVHRLGMIPLVFTAGHVIGDDRLSNQIYGMSGSDLASLLGDLDVSVIVKVNSLKGELQNRIVGLPKFFFKGKRIVISQKEGERYDFTRFSKLCIERLIEVGLNRSNPTRLGADILVLGGKYRNYEEILRMYAHFRRLNIYPLVVTFIPCGKTKWDEQREVYDVCRKEKIDLWKRIYWWNMNPRNKIKFEGVSAFAGGHVCRQRNFALYANVRGEVYPCPGGLFEERIGSLVGAEKKTLKELWESARARRIRRNGKDRRYNGLICRPRTQLRSLPPELGDEVENYVKSLIAYHAEKKQ